MTDEHDPNAILGETINNDPKPLIASKSFWGLVLGIAGPLLARHLGVELSAAEAGEVAALLAAIAGGALGVRGILTRSRPVAGVIKAPPTPPLMSSKPV